LIINGHFYSLWNTPVVVALEVRLGITFRAILRQFVTVVSTIVLSVAEQPFRNATVVRLTRTTGPSGGAILLSTHVGRFIGVVAAVVVKVTHPQFRYATSVLAAELCLWVALSLV
jgi:hypothetical protein